jgi:hypothetical protein
VSTVVIRRDFLQVVCAASLAPAGFGLEITPKSEKPASQPPVAPHWPVGAVILVRIDSRRAPAGAAAFVDRAMKTWTDAAAGRFTLKMAAEADDAMLKVRFVSSDGLFGEALPRVDPRRGAIVAAEVVINADVEGDALQQRIIVYLTALHELGHALGLPHTDEFETIMYSFRRADDGTRYFGAYRQRVRSIDDIGSSTATGLAPSDIAALRTLYDRSKP